MLYLSRGTPYDARENTLTIRHFGVHRLSRPESDVWRNGKNRFAFAATAAEQDALNSLSKKGLAICSPKNTPNAKFMILSRFLIIPSNKFRFHLPFRGMDRTIMIWLKKAGFHVTLAELVFLIDRNIKPTKQLLKTENRLLLVQTIYPTPVVMAGQLEHAMANAPTCSIIVGVLMQLVQKGHIILF